MRDYLRTFSLCFEFWKNYRATEPFPGIGFQTTNERRSPDDLPRSEVKQSNPISAQYRLNLAKDNIFSPNPFIQPLAICSPWNIWQSRPLPFFLLCCSFPALLN